MAQLSNQALQYFDYQLRNVPSYDNKLTEWREKKRYLDMELDSIGVKDEKEREEITRQYLGNEPLYDGSFLTERLPEAFSQGIDKAGMNIGGMIEYIGSKSPNAAAEQFGRDMAAENRQQLAEAPQFMESPEALDKKGFLSNIDDYSLAALSDIIGSSPVMAAPIVGGAMGGIPGAVLGTAGALGGGALLEGGSTYSDYRAQLLEEGATEQEAAQIAKVAADDVVWENLTDAELLPYALAQGLSGPILGALSKLGRAGKLGKFGNRMKNFTPTKQALAAGAAQVGTGAMQERRQYEVTESATGNPMDRFEGFETPEGRFAATVGGFAEGPMSILEAATAKDRDTRVDPVKTELQQQATGVAQEYAGRANQEEAQRQELEARNKEAERVEEQLRKREEAEQKAYEDRIKAALDIKDKQDRAEMTRKKLLVQEAKTRSELRNIEEAQKARGEADSAKKQERTQQDLAELQKEISELEELQNVTAGSKAKKSKGIQGTLKRSIENRKKKVAQLERVIAENKGRTALGTDVAAKRDVAKQLRNVSTQIKSLLTEADQIRKTIVTKQAKGEDVSDDLTRFEAISKQLDDPGSQTPGLIRQAENLQSQLDPTGDVAAAPSEATATQKRQLKEETTNEALAGILGRTPQTPAEQVAEQLSPAPQDIPEFEGVTPATEQEMEEGAGLDVASGLADRLVTTGREMEELAPREPTAVDPRPEVRSREIQPKESSEFFDPSLDAEDQAPYFTSANQEAFNESVVDSVEQERSDQAAQDRISRKRVDRLPDDIDQLMDVARPPQEPPARETLPEQLTQKAFGELRSPVDEAEAEADIYVQEKREEIRKRVADEIKARADLGDKKPRGMKMGSADRLKNPVRVMQEIANGDVVETQLSFEQLRLLDQALTSERRKGVIDNALKMVLDKNPDLRASTPKTPTQEAPTTTPEAPTPPAEVAGQTAGEADDVIAKYEKMAKKEKAAREKKKKAEPKQKRGRTIADKNAKKIQPDVTQETIEQQTAQFLEDGGEVTQVEEVKKEPTKTQKALEEFNRKVEEKENVQPESEAPKATGRLRKKGEKRTEDQGVVQEEPAAETQATAEETLKKYRETVKRELGKPMDLTTDEISELIDDQDIGGITDAYLNYNFREELGKAKEDKDVDIENKLKDELEALGVDPDRVVEDFQKSLVQQTLSFSKKTAKENAKPAFGNLSKIQAQAALRGMQTIVQRLNEKSFLSDEGGYIRVAENINDAIRMLREMGEGAAALQLAREVRNNPNDIFEAFITKKDGQVILVADQMQGTDLNSAVERMVEVVFHEVIGHKGLRALMGEDYNTFIDQYGRRYKKDIQNWLKTDGKAYQGEPTFFKQTEEYIAINFAEKGAQKIGFLDNLIQSIAGKLGLAKYSNTALKRAMLMIEQDLAGSGGSILDGVNIGFVADAQSLEEDEKQDGTYQPRELNYSRREYQDALNKTGLIHNNLIAARLGQYPDYLNPVVNAMQQMQQSFNSGNLRVRDVAKGYFITISSMGKKEQPRTTIEAQLRRQIPGFTELPPQFVENYNGKEVVRPEENAAWALTTDLGQRLLNDLENGKYDAKGWVDLASNYFSKTYGRNDLLKPGYLQGKGGGYSLERVQELTDAVNAKPGDTDNLYAQMNKFQGIGEGKTGFIASMFGVGGMLTLDAVELNAWITGQGDITPLTRAVDSEMGINQQPSILGIKQDYEQKFAEAENNPDLSEEDKGKLFKQLRRGKTTELNSERMRLRIEFLDGKVEPVGGRPAQLTPEQRERLRLRYLFKDANKDDQAQLRDIVAQRFGEIRDDGTLEPSQGMQQIPVDLFEHVVHHWAWDAYKGARTKHEGIYDAMLNYSRRVDEVDSKMVHGELYSDSTLSFSKKRLLESGVPEKLADELAGKKMGILTADRTKWGKYKGMNPGSLIDLFMFGGPAYGENNKGKGAAWASAEDAAKKFFNPISEFADRGLFGIVLLKHENHLGSYGVFQAFVAELKEGKQFGSYDWDMTTRIFEKMKEQTRLLKEFPGAADAKDIVELYEGILENVGHRERGKYITRMIEAKGDRSTKREGFASAGLKDLAMYVMQETADSRFLNTPMGTMVGIGQVDPKGKVSSASDFGVQEHPSYNSVIPGTFLTMLKNPVPLWDHAFDWIINQDKQPNPFFRTKKDEQGQSIKEFEPYTRVAQKKSSSGKPLFDASGNPVMSSQNRTEAAQESGVTMYYMTAPDQSVQEIAQDVLTQIPDDAPNLSYSRRLEQAESRTERSGLNASIDAIEAQASRAVDMLWQKSVILDKAYEKTMDLLEPMSSLPRLKEYLAARRRLRGVIDRNEEIATKVYDAFKDSKNPKQVYEFMTTKDADPTMITNRMERATAERAKKAIEQIGDRMVEAGLTEQATIDAMKGQYLPRVYLKYLLKDEDANMMFRNNRRPSDLGYIKNRKDIPEGIRKLILGEIEDPAYLASRAIMQPGRDLALLDWMSWISTQSDWTLQQSLVNFDLQDRMRQVAKRIGGDNLVQQMGITVDRVKQREDIANQIKELREEIKQVKKENQAVPVKGQAKLLSAKNAELKTLIKERDKLPSNYKVTPHYLMAEAERIETQILNNDNEIVSGQERQVLMEVVNEMRNASRGQIADIDTMGLSPKEWKQIPDTKRYGKLRGMTVRAEIYDDIIGTYNMSPDSSEGFAGKLLGDGGYLAQANSIWKWSKVAANPPSYIRNFTSNVILMNLGGVRIQRVPGLIGKAFEAYTGKGKYYQLAKKHGLLSSGFSGNEIQMLENEYVAAQRRAAKDGGLSGYAAMRIAADVFTKIQNMTGDAYGFVDGFGKIMMMTDAMENQGMNEADAAAYAEKWLFDYSHVGANVRFLRNHALGSPFITFTAKVAPRLLETMRYKPWRFAPWIGLSYALAEAVKSAFDWDDEDVEAAFLALPDYLREKGQTAVVPLPFKDAEGRIQFLDISYLLPWGLFQEIGNEVSRGDIGAAFMSTGLLGGPVMSIATAIQSNKDSFTQREIIDRTKDPASQIADLFLYAYNMSAPPFMNTEYGGIRRMQQALTGELDQMGQPTYTVGQAAGRLSGFNTTPLDLRQSRSDNIRRFEREISNLRRDKTRDVRRAYRMKKDRAEINEIINDYNDLIKEKRDALIEYRKKSRLPIGA